MAAGAFLEAVAAFLGGPAGLDPAPVTAGIAEPDPVAQAFPALVLSLEELRPAGSGLGQRSAPITGALPWQAVIDLATPVLPEEPGHSLLSPDRLRLILPHGGLVCADGSSGPLEPDDLAVTVAGIARPVVSGAPAGDEVRADPATGTLVFGSPLPAAGLVVAEYVLGQWEQRTERLAGVLRVDACGLDAAAVGDLSDGAVAALQGPLAALHVRRLLRIGLTGLSSIGPAEPALANARRRTARLAFDFEHEINRPESSGGVIRQVHLTTGLVSATVDKTTGAISTAVAIETD